MAIGSMVLCGLLIGLAFDLYRVVSFRFRVPRWLLPALDIVYWTAATLGVFWILLLYNQGEVRLYVFLGLGIGVTGYFGLFSPWVIKAANLLLSLLIVLTSWMQRIFRVIFLLPGAAFVRLLAKLLDILFVLIAALLLWIGRLLLIPLRPLGRYAWDLLLPVRNQAAAWAEAGKRRVRKWKAVWRTVWEAIRKK